LLGETGAEVHERRFLKEKPTVDEVRAVAALLPGGVRDLLSTRGRRFREMGLAGKAFTDEELIQLLAEEPGLWRRPIVIRGEQVVIGYDPKSLEALLS
jgi:arsenate reductase-like glutaredoxin family protein